MPSSAYQELNLLCNTEFSNATEEYLSTDCGETGNAASQTAAAALVDGTPTWATRLDLSNLLIGTTYKLCADLDGAENLSAVGDAGLTILAAGPTELLTYGMPTAPEQVLHIRCAAGCRTTSTGHLGMMCSETALDGVHNGSKWSTLSSPLLGAGSWWELVVGTTQVVPRMPYKLALISMERP